MLGLQSARKDLGNQSTRELLQASLQKGGTRDWWLGDGHLYEVWIQPIFFGQTSDNNTVGFLVVGHEVDDVAARDFSNIVSSQVAFAYDGNLVAGTLDPAQKSALAGQIQKGSQRSSDAAQQVQLGNEQYVIATVTLGPRCV